MIEDTDFGRDESASADELEIVLEQLRIAEEELRSQNEELVAARDALEVERQRYCELFDHAPDAYVVTDTFGKIVEANRRAALLLAVEQRFLVGRLLVSFVPSEARSAFRRLLIELGRLEDEEELELELQLRARTGETFDASASVTAARRAGNPHEGLRWLLRDLTARKLAERGAESAAAELHRRVAERAEALDLMSTRAGDERDRLRQTLERLPEGIVTFDRDLRIEFANRAARRLLEPADVSPRDPLPDPWPELSLRELASSLFRARPALGETRVRVDDARMLAVRGIHARGSGTAVLVIADVSGQERRERAERDFVTNAAHELRTPLAAITSAIEVLQAGAKQIPEERDRFLAHIERETARLGRLARALLLLARVQTGEEAPRLELLTLAGLLEDVAATIHPGDGIAVKVDCSAEIAVLANRDLVEQALSNLATNAAKYTRKGEITITARELSSRSVELAVVDTGPGMAAEDRERVLERFYRGGSADGADGFGLGLAIASQAVRAVGGELKIDSEPGKGTRAWFALPAARLVQR